MRRDQILKSPRFAGEVRRYHTWPVHREQTVGEHTWQVFRIWQQMWGMPSERAFNYLLYSDVGELVLGDLPFPVKANNPALKAECDEVERTALMAMLAFVPASPTDIEKNQAKVCDLTEMWEFGCTELQLGNQFAISIIEDTRTAALAFVNKLPNDLRNEAMRYIQRSALLATGVP